ncbi:hypothetical protein CHS0354_018926 [Potamilus streckersoni]|uniref:Lon protease homolog 2, peroxisomal n=1 Tax=Potamilus streckersoni TaxID=2493646 RepID=A0AAE0RMY5_9BIVA|nr:hypothetical protein CHS0354_018926 [Potamilus streckersoni]
MASTISIPRRLPLLVVADSVLLPGSAMRIPVKDMKNMNMVKSHVLSKNTLRSTIIGVIPKEAASLLDESEDISTLHPIGTAAVVVQVTGTNWPKPAYTLLVTGLCRFKIEELLQETPFPIATVTQLDKLPGDQDDSIKSNSELNSLAGNFREQAAKLVDMLDISIPVVAKLKRMLESLPSQHLPDICAAIVKASYTEKIQVLDSVDLTERFKKALPLLMRQIEGLKLLQKARKDKALEIVTRREGGRPRNMQRVFQGKLNTDVDEEDDAEGDEMADLEQKIKNANMPEQAFTAAMKEFKRLKKMPQHMPEQAMIRNYLELLVELPWSKQTKDVLDISQARKYLDDDHYGLEKVKIRVVEYLAVRQLKNSLKGPILCFIGPPGVGKTSIGKSIAHTLGREFHRISLGGVCDQSDIRGHRRTYIGSMPGRIIQGLKTVGVRNPVFLLDEVDKLGKSLHGDPAAALLEVLDPEQNHTFVDHYLNIPFDLSQVVFIATANNMASIPPALLDRMEVVHIPGYTQEEKVNIASSHLIPKQLKNHGLTSEQIQIPDETIRTIAANYTREAGVRNLDRKLAAVCRAVAVRVAENITKSKKDLSEKKKVMNVSLPEDVSQDASTLAHPPEMPIVIDEAALKDILGAHQYESEVSQRLTQPGVAVGLAWTPMGGEILFVEASSMKGDGSLTLTGQLGDVMKESANLAMNWVRSHSKQLGFKHDILENLDVHIHFPAGAVEKDGPSAGITITTVLVSLFSNRCVRSDTAMTGEITLRGLVLPVGGMKEKVLAAHRAGIKRVILPKRNEKDLNEIPSSVKDDLTIILASKLEEVLNAAFHDGFPSLSDDVQIPSKL